MIATKNKVAPIPLTPAFFTAWGTPAGIVANAAHQVTTTTATNSPLDAVKYMHADVVPRPAVTTAYAAIVEPAKLTVATHIPCTYSKYALDAVIDKDVIAADTLRRIPETVIDKWYNTILEYDFSQNLPKDPAFTVADTAKKIGNLPVPAGPTYFDSTEDRWANRKAEDFTNMVWRSVKRFGVGVTK